MRSTRVLGAASVSESVGSLAQFDLDGAEYGHALGGAVVADRLESDRQFFCHGQAFDAADEGRAFSARRLHDVDLAQVAEPSHNHPDVPSQEYPVIHSEASDLDRLIAGMPSLVADATRVTHQLNKLLADDNLAELANVMRNARAMTEPLPQAAREAGNMIDLDSNPTKLIEVVEIGKQLLMTRGALTTFSIANDVAKYFAIIPAMFLAFYPQLQVLNVMHLASPQSAILSAIIFNALIIIALIPHIVPYDDVKFCEHELGMERVMTPLLDGPLIRVDRRAYEPQLPDAVRKPLHIFRLADPFAINNGVVGDDEEDE